MTGKTKKADQTYLKAARLEMGYTSREAASEVVPYTPESIGRHERGEISIGPEDAIVYANSYGRDDILMRYCARCPIGLVMGRQVLDRDLPMATLRLVRRLRGAAEETVADLEWMADDGVLDEQDQPKLESALNSLKELSATIEDFILYAATHGKGRPAQTTRSA